MMVPLLSIVVPYYGVEQYIGKCLESLRRQTMPDFEVIMVDDGSQDGSSHVAHTYADIDPRFRVLTQPNSGLGPARNAGADQARGEFLAFVDSDDLVAWHAYEVLLGVLRKTGSDFAASDARRFDRVGGVRASWAHRDEFAHTVERTSIRERPGLVMDRMVWNKVYRREFFTRNGYQFPAIQYEDFPVTLKAHLDAAKVDLVSAPLYYWRERDSGGSATQRVHAGPNLRDRVRSAELVLALLSEGPDDVRLRLHTLLARIDLLAIMQTFGSVQEIDPDSVVSLGERLADQLDPGVLDLRPPLDRLQLAALRRGDAQLLTQLARFRSSGGEARARVHRRATNPTGLVAEYPGLGRREYSGNLFLVPDTSVGLETRVTALDWSESQLRIRGSVSLAHVDAAASDGVSLALAAGDDLIPIALEEVSCETRDDGTSAHFFQANVELAELIKIPREAWPLPIVVSITTSQWQRQGPLRGLQAGSPIWSIGAWMQPDVLVRVTTGRAGAVLLARMTSPTLVDSVTAEAGRFTISGHTPGACATGSLEVVRRPGREPTTIPATLAPEGGTTRFVIELPVGDLLDAETPVDPFTHRSAWPLRLRTGASARELHVLHSDQAVLRAPGGTTLRVGGGPGGRVHAVWEPAATEVEAVRLTPGAVSVSGRSWTPERPIQVLWRPVGPSRHSEIDVACATVLDQAHWQAELPTAALTHPGTGKTAPRMVRRWVLMVRTAADYDVVRCTEGAGHLLPLEVETPEATMRCTMIRETLQVEVR